MKIFGNIIPFVGFRTYYVGDDGLPLEPDDVSNYESDCFEIEWLGYGIILFSTNIRIVKK